MIIDGRQIGEQILGDAWQEVSSKGLKLKLSAVLVGSNPEFKKFVELKGKVAEKIGVGFEIHQFPENISTEELKNEVTRISIENDGVLVELPLPSHIDTQTVLNEVPLKKDVDVLSEEAQAAFYKNEFKVLPPAVEAAKIIFEKYKIELKDKTAVVFGQGLLVGKPIAHWLESQGAKVSIIRSATENPEKYSKEADIIISGVGKPGLINGSMVKEGAVVFDFGYENKDGKMVGDVDFDLVASKASLITPVPGGMGPIVIAAVLKNLVKLSDSPGLS